MAFLLGYFGKNLAPDLTESFRIHAEQKANGKLTQIVNDHLVMYAGYNAGEVISNSILSLDDNAGILVGKIFDKIHYKQVLDEQALNSVISDPARLIHDFWGRYVGALYNAHQKKITLIRDPLGLSTIYYAEIQDGLVFSTDLALLYDTLLEKPNVNWNYFAEFIAHENPALPRVPFEGFYELTPGEVLSYDLESRITSDHPWNLEGIQGHYIRDKEELELEILDMLKKCTAAWVEQSSGICLQLSGGLDSSALAILLSQVASDKKLVAINYFDSKNPSSNEIDYAQEIAQQCGIQLNLIDWQTSSILDPLPTEWRPNKPLHFLLFYTMGKQIEQVAIDNGCSDIMSGQGGDHIFLAPTLHHAVSDAWLQVGLGEALRVNTDLSNAHKISWTTLLWKNIQVLKKYYTNASTRKRIKLDALSPEYREGSFYDFHVPHTLKKLPPGKQTQFKELFNAVGYADRDRRWLSMTCSHPLLSQPLVELALQIPTYQSYEAGHERIFFRKAMDRISKSPALWRTVKGGTTATAGKSIARNAKEIRKILFSGSLAQSGILNKEWLEKQIQRIQHTQSFSEPALVNALVSQLWLNQWKK